MAWSHLLPPWGQCYHDREEMCILRQLFCYLQDGNLALLQPTLKLLLLALLLSSSFAVGHKNSQLWQHAVQPYCIHQYKYQRSNTTYKRLSSFFFYFLFCYDGQTTVISNVNGSTIIFSANTHKQDDVVLIIKGTATLVCAKSCCNQRWRGAPLFPIYCFSSFPSARIYPTAKYSRIHCVIEGFQPRGSCRHVQESVWT